MKPTYIKYRIGKLPAFFDDIFYGRLHPQEWRMAPGNYFALFFGGAWALMSFRTVSPGRAVAGDRARSFFAACMAFGVVSRKNGFWKFRFFARATYREYFLLCFSGLVSPTGWVRNS